MLTLSLGLSALLGHLQERGYKRWGRQADGELPIIRFRLRTVHSHPIRMFVLLSFASSSRVSVVGTQPMAAFSHNMEC